MDKYNEWLNDENIESIDKEYLKNMAKEEIENSFSEDLKFGTSGIRALMGLGSSKMNKYTIGKVTVGLANYLNKNNKGASVVIAYDTRNNSKEFAYETALILNYYKIKTYLFKEVTSTPELAFSIKYLNCTSGIVITSSHNPKEYNGYKVYNSLGYQIVPPEDDLIISEINSITSFKSIKKAPLNNDLFNYVDDSVHKNFLLENEKVILNNDLFKEYASKINVTYTSMHGVGLKTAKEIFDKYGFNYNIVKEQCTYDGNFKTAPEPNPEYIKNYDLAIKYAKENNSDIILATDPDADRLGIMYKNNDVYEYINGNIVGCLFLNYILNNIKIKNNSYIVRSIVTSPFIDKIAKKYNVKVYEVLTGCKNIANKIINKREENYIFGYEESIGYMFNIGILDKCGFSAMIMILEILCYLKSKNIELNDYIQNIYKEFGYIALDTINIVFEDTNIIQKYMDDFRKDIIQFNNKNYTKKDYLNEVGENNTNALKYNYDDGLYIMIRPSGTEPKLKIYIGSLDKDENRAKEKLEKVKKEINCIFNR
ncbi:MAG: phospho-sugar mutase [Bacilli bacterium]|nr:phospho-sugar mutase [Bacilli bacterium]